MLASAAAMLAPVALAQIAPRQVLGMWSCSAALDDGKVLTWSADYQADGKLITIRFNWPEFDTGGPFVETKTRFEGSWKIDAGKLVEQLGREIEMTLVTSEDGVRQARVVKVDRDTHERPFTYSVNVKGDTFSAKAQDGLVNTCKRKANE